MTAFKHIIPSPEIQQLSQICLLHSGENIHNLKFNIIHKFEKHKFDTQVRAISVASALGMNLNGDTISLVGFQQSGVQFYNNVEEGDSVILTSGQVRNITFSDYDMTFHHLEIINPEVSHNI